MTDLATLLPHLRAIHSFVEQYAPAPAPSPTPTPKGGVRLSDVTDASWDRGVRRTSNIVRVPYTSASAAVFVLHTAVSLADEEARTVRWVETRDGHLNIHLTGSSLRADVVGYPNAIHGPDSNPEPVPVPVPVPVGFPLVTPLSVIGVNLAGAEFGPGTPHYNWPYEHDFLLWKDAGVTVVRIPFKWERMQPELFGPLDSKNSSELLRVLGLAEKHGMLVLTDLHNYYRYNGHVVGTAAVPIASLVNMWQKVAALTKGHKGLWAHGLMNEPYASQPTWPAAAKACYEAIQAIEPGRWVAIGGDHWSNASGAIKHNPSLHIPGAQFAIYEFHCYLDHDQSGSYKDRSAVIPEGVAVQRLKGAVDFGKRYGVPVIIGEYGLPNNMPQAFDEFETGIQYLSDNRVICFLWAGGSHWTESSASAIQLGGRSTPRLGALQQAFLQFKGQTIDEMGPD